MTDFKLTDQWNNSIEAWWEKLKSVDTVNWRNERCVLPPYQHNIIFPREIHSLSQESIVVFKDRALKARMLRDVAERNSVLWKMGVMKPDYDISLEDGLRCAMKFGIPLEEEWHLDSSVRPVENLESFKIVDYKKVDQKYVSTILKDLRSPLAEHCYLEVIPIQVECQISLRIASHPSKRYHSPASSHPFSKVHYFSLPHPSAFEP
ncbi:hypothetical protein FF1_005594 [Malus domestica]